VSSVNIIILLFSVLEERANFRIVLLFSLAILLLFFLLILYRERVNRRNLYRISMSTAMSLVRVLELKDSRSRGHSERVAYYADQLARAMKLPHLQLSIAALLHDIGKIALPDTILEKPITLTPEEWEIMKKHSELGYFIVKYIEPLKNLAPWVRWHHERWDGSGYPDGLKGEEIPIEAQIISVADFFDSVTKRPYWGKHLNEEEALLEIEKKRGVFWDPKLVDVAIKNLHIIPDEIEQKVQFEMIDRARRSPYSAERLFVLHQIAEEIKLLGDLDSFLHRILQILRGVVGESYLYTLYLGDEGGNLTVAAALGWKEEMLGKSIPLDSSLPGWAFIHKESTVSMDTKQDPRYYPTTDEVILSEISVPLIVGERVIGVLDVASPQRDAFRRSDLDFLEMVSSAISGAIEAARLYRKLQQLAFYDTLTGVHTFHHLADIFNREKEKWLSEGKVVSIVFIDTDGLKGINDQYGHLVGDEILRTFARSLKEGIDENALIGRYGGDEFVILLPKKEREEAEDLVKRIKKEVEAIRIKVDGSELPLIRFSYGISEFPKDGLELEPLIKKADERMYRYKRKRQ
jgi:diguanylate cyclase (GGDEF)-like protein/putative nucleotidyltransferase with HDIG domain